jgi:dienelactone hydrolase
MTTSRRSLIAGSTISLLGGSSILPAQTPDTNVHENIRRSAEQASLSMRIDARELGPRRIRAWQHKFRSILARQLGNYKPPGSWQVSRENVTRLDDHTRHQLVLSAKGHPNLPVYLLVPREQSLRPGPGVVAIHGHGDFGYETVAGRDDLEGVSEAIEKANYDYGRQLVREGYVVCIPCLVPFGRRVDRKAHAGQDPCAVTFVRMQLLGRVLMGENLRDCLWAFELLRQHPQVDADRIGCVGLSYGGRMTMLTAAMQPRIRAAVVSGALNVMQERVSVRYSCGGQVIPGLLKFGDVQEIGSLIAPRPCVWETGSEDGLIIEPWASEAMDRIKQVYHVLGAADQIQRDVFDGGHRWNGVVGMPILRAALAV